MTIYTIIANDLAIEGTRCMGLGVYRHSGGLPCGIVIFHGTACWPTYHAAHRYLRWCPDLERQRVMGLDGDWDRDTWQMDGIPFRYTLVDLHICDVR